MSNESQVLDVLYGCLDQFNKQLPPDHKIEKTTDTKLTADGGDLDSLGLITLLVEMEESLKKKLDIKISLVDELSRDHTDNPFSTVGTLAEWISRQEK